MTPLERKRLKRLKQKLEQLKEERERQSKIINSFETGEMIIGEKHENRDTNEASKSK